jgi:hypothetical protein
MEAHITVGQIHYDKLRQLVEKSNCKHVKTYCESMINYFQEMGIDPTARDLTVLAELSKLRNTMISFIREHDKRKLNPLVANLAEIMVFLKEFLKNEAVSKSDFKEFTTNLKSELVLQPNSSPVLAFSNDDDRYVTLLHKVKSIVNEFTNNLRTSPFGGYTLDKALLENFKSSINDL